MTELPDEVLPEKLDAAERLLARAEHRWFALAVVLAALASGAALLLPWAFSRRLGQSVWQLGVEVSPELSLAWVAGLVTAVIALWVRPGIWARTAASISGVVALVYAAGGWQARDLGPSSDSWAGPGPAIAVVAGVCWILAATALLVADRPRSRADDPDALTDAVTRLRANR
ncbi:hypothetical protein FB561_0892 [Kribbella amoyensis]|uniref:Tryptophan-associated transmembrane protein n=1 Tax=Kribbella amoyensis TaxID=996641 RepID=A0A561BLQ2_9ACTN|nr:hypothetical protein [Kribbella amoyensis]TWD79826.1 hypothetical protein FB561_0892 [Kribbella amoyensis]